MKRNSRIRRAVASDATAIAIVQAYTWLTTYRGLLPDDVLEARVNALPKQAVYLDAQISEGKSFYVADFRERSSDLRRAVCPGTKAIPMMPKCRRSIC